MEAGCGLGYAPMYGSIVGPGINQNQSSSITFDQCRKGCTAIADCRSFEWFPSTNICQLNKQRTPTAKATKGIFFCSRLGDCKYLYIIDIGINSGMKMYVICGVWNYFTAIDTLSYR